MQASSVRTKDIASCHNTHEITRLMLENEQSTDRVSHPMVRGIAESVVCGGLISVAPAKPLKPIEVISEYPSPADFVARSLPKNIYA